VVVRVSWLLVALAGLVGVVQLVALVQASPPLDFGTTDEAAAQDAGRRLLWASSAGLVVLGAALAAVRFRSVGAFVVAAGVVPPAVVVLLPRWFGLVPTAVVLAAVALVLWLAGPRSAR
jgi:hypothetical protein